MFLALHFAKLLAVAALWAGTIGVFVARDPAARRRFAYGLAGPAFGATWALGFALVAWLEVPVLATWILGSLALSVASLQVVLWVAGREGRGGWGSAILAIGALAGTMALMVWRPA